MLQSWTPSGTNVNLSKGLNDFSVQGHWSHRINCVINPNIPANIIPKRNSQTEENTSRNVYQNLTNFFEGKNNLRKMKTIPYHQKLMVIFYSDILMQKVALSDSLAWNWDAEISSHVPSDMKKGRQPKKVSRTHQCLNSLIRDIIICQIISSNNIRGEKYIFETLLLPISF